MHYHLLVVFTIMVTSLVACDKPVPTNLPDEPVTVPVPESSIGKGRTGDEGIDGGTKSETEKPVDQIDTEPSKPDGDGSIVIPPPVVDMPPEIVKDKP